MRKRVVNQVFYILNVRICGNIQVEAAGPVALELAGWREWRHNFSSH